MPVTLTETAVPTESITRTERLRRFMNAYWLRPENALWMALRSEVLADTSWHSPSVDLCCGDGVFSFLHAGGTFSEDFDVFTGVGPLSVKQGDPADIFDHVDTQYQPMVEHSPDSQIEVGTDWKPNLLTKAGRLGLYDELIVHDCNRPLPFEDGSFRTVYCNSIYWMQNIDGLLDEMNRICSDDGVILLEVKLDSVLRYTLESYRETLGDRFLEIIGRGRAETWPSLTNRSTWEQQFSRAGLTIQRAVPFVTRTHAHLWDVGLRPIAPALIELANNVTPETRGRVKRWWVDLFCELCAPLCDPNADVLPGQDEPAEILYELRPT